MEMAERQSFAPPKEQEKSRNPKETAVNPQGQALLDLYRLIPSNVLDNEVKHTFQQILASLQTVTIPKALAASYPPEELKKYQETAQEAFEKMGQINRERVESLVGLASQEMNQALMEILLLFDVNAPSVPLQISEPTTELDEEGDVISRTHTFAVFQEGALAGIDGLKRFLPPSLLQGNKEIPGMDTFLWNQFGNLSTQLGSAPFPYVKAISSAGSLGGIGHKPDSDLDAQIVFDTSPQFKEPWNDADFFIALLQQIFQGVAQDFYNNQLSPAQKLKLTAQVEAELREKYGQSLSEEEQQAIAWVLPSLYRNTLEQKTWAHFYQLESSQQALLLWKKIGEILRQNPFFEKFIAPLSRFFSFIKINQTVKKIRQEWFPYSLATLSKQKIFEWLADFYQQRYLNPADAKQLVRRYRNQHQINQEVIDKPTQRKIFLEHLATLNQRSPVLKDFLKRLMGQISLEFQPRLADILGILAQTFDKKRQLLTPTFCRELEKELRMAFRKQMVAVVDFYSEQQACQLEAQCEWALHQKMVQVEHYMAMKYPSVEVHVFTNLLRNQRAGRHTPFLVSSEGSMAYDVMLNDFLLNPAVLLAGTTPIPFQLPHALKTLCRIGVLPEGEWTLRQSQGDGGEEFPLSALPDWGESEIPRQKLLEHALPIFLRESEKISHRNLPKALLNCWWVEMVCLEEEQQPLTSLTHLLYHPDERHFVRQDLKTPQLRAIRMMEKECPLLVKDPWWIKFTEMFSRFEDGAVRQQMIFCFAQHIRLSDIINFETGALIWLEEGISWRTKALASFYNFFYENHEERVEQVLFAQGRDDVANRVEKTLKTMFLQSMQRVEQRLISLQNNRALKLLMGYVLKMGVDTIGPKARVVATQTMEQLQNLHQNILIVDETIAEKVEAAQTLSEVEAMQWEVIEEDRQRLRKTVQELTRYYESQGLTPNPPIIEQHILNTRFKLAGNPLENFIFKYHFERNFKKKPYQVPIPISKTLSIPRNQILLDLNNKTQKWVFKSVLSKNAMMGQTSRHTRRAASEIEMFQAPLVEGIARCVISGYLGFGSHNLTSFEKPPTRAQGTAASNPITHQDIQMLAQEMNDFFAPLSVRPRELLENIHYIRDIFMVCNVNRFSALSLVVRDNFGDCFVNSFHLDRIQVNLPPSFLKVDFNLSRFFLQFNTRQCRHLFMTTLGRLNIPLRIEYAPRLKIWINPGNFNLLIAPKFYRLYLDAIVESLWSSELLGTAEFLQPKKLTQPFDFIGKEAIKNRASAE